MKHRLVIACGLMALVVAGCGGGSDFEAAGSMELSWGVGGTTCSAVGVSTVRVSIYDAVGLYTTENTACQLATMEVRELPAGSYTIQVDGFRAGSDVPSYSGTLAAIDVRPDTLTVAPRIEMTEMPGGLDVIWRFDSGDLCGFMGVDTIILNVWDGHSNRIYESSLPCDPFTAKMEMEAEAAQQSVISSFYDEARYILIPQLYAGQYTIRAFGMQAGVDLHPRFWAEAHPVVTHSKLTLVQLSLKSCEMQNPDGSTALISICY
ncbi:MAG: hypothetical protein ACI9WU_003507 [Myxococcota bacterium]|jgi:hypothetical protein